MIELFAAAVIAGIVLGAPFGASGGMVANAALTHDKRRLCMTILAAGAGDTTLAFITSLAAVPVSDFLEEYKHLFHLVSGLAIISLSLYVGINAWISGNGITEIDGSTGRKSRLLNDTVSSASVYVIAVVHPGSIAAYLFVTALFSMKIDAFPVHRGFFVGGIALGSLTVFSLAASLFWKIRKKADRYVHYFRYGIAAVIFLAGVYLLFK